METGLTGFDEIEIPGAPDAAAITKALSKQTPDRIRTIAQAMRHGMSDDDITRSPSLTRGSLPVSARSSTPRQVIAEGLPDDRKGMRDLKMMGFTDARLAKLTSSREAEVRDVRHALGVNAVFKRIDTCAAEFEAQTPYMYSTYESPVMGESNAKHARLTAKRWSSWAVVQTASAKASSSIIAAATPVSR